MMFLLLLRNRVQMRLDELQLSYRGRPLRVPPQLLRSPIAPATDTVSSGFQARVAATMEFLGLTNMAGEVKTRDGMLTFDLLVQWKVGEMKEQLFG